MYGLFVHMVLVYSGVICWRRVGTAMPQTLVTPATNTRQKNSMVRILKVLIVLRMVPVSKSPSYKFSWPTSPTCACVLVWFLLPSVFFCATEWSVSEEISAALQLADSSAILRRYSNCEQGYS